MRFLRSVYFRSGRAVCLCWYVSCSTCLAARSRRRISPAVFRALLSFSKRARPKDAAEIAKIDGVVDFRGVQKNKRIVVVRDEESGMEEEHLIPLTKHLIIQKGDHVIKGQQLTDGLVVPQEILEICGVRELQKYLVNQVQEVYRLQGVDINDKHIEIIVRQMLQKVRVTDPGDTTFLYGEDVDKKDFHRTNRKDDRRRRKTCSSSACSPRDHESISWYRVVRLGGFIPGDDSRLTEAACEGKTDYLLDFKANLIMGHMIPGGTGFEEYRKRVLKVVDREGDELVLSFTD